MRSGRRHRIFLAAALCVGATPLSAQIAGADGRTVYDAVFFQSFAPANALQIVERVPGFAIEQSEEEVRGFAQAAGNIVINGQRPSSKSEPLETVLARIPATRVTRVEVARGDLFGSEYAGKAQVLNLVLTDAGGIAGTLEASVWREFTGTLLPEASASVLLRRGASTFNLGIGLINRNTTEEGFDRLTALPSGAEVEFRQKTNRIRDPNGYASASWEYNGGTHRTAHVNLRRGFDRFQLTQSNQVFPAAGAIRDDRLTQRYDRDDFEIGADVTRPFAGGGVKLIGLATRRHRTFDDVSLLRVAGETIGGFTQFVDNQRDETVIRAVWSRPDLGGWSVETGAEGALNRLDSDVDLAALAAGGAVTPIDLPVDQAVVEEYRGEAFVNAGRALSPTLRLDAGLTVETSRLTVTGDAEAERRLTFLKPKATLDWKLDEKWRAQLTVQRTVAQLQFEDFISVAELANDRVNGGNANLVPQRAWEALVTVQRPILTTGLVKLEGGFQRISLVQDRIPTPEGFDAPGNLGDGTVGIARATLDAPLGAFGIKGGRLTLYGSYAASSVEDPYTLADRRFSGNSDFAFEASFRQDLGRFAWGLTLSGNTPSTFYRRNELDTLIAGIPYAVAFAEYRPSKRTTVTLTLDNLADTRFSRERLFFAPDRTSASPDLVETRARDRHVVPYLTVKHSFG